jgi:hypothetical protein
MGDDLVDQVNASKSEVVARVDMPVCPAPTFDT